MKKKIIQALFYGLAIGIVALPGWADFFGANSLGGGFVAEPEKIVDSGLIAQWGCEDSFGNTVDSGDVISNVNDATSSNYDLTASGAARPSLLSAGSGIGNRCAFGFNGSQYATRTTGFPTNADYSLVVVYDSSNFSDGSAHNLVGATSGSSHSLYYPANVDDLTVYHGAANMITTTTNHTTSTPYIATFIWSHSALDGWLYVNGKLVGTTTSGTAANNANIQLGAFNSASAWKGKIARVLLYNKQLSDAERNQNLRVLGNYYGTSVADVGVYVFGDSNAQGNSGQISNANRYGDQFYGLFNPALTSYTMSAVVGDNCSEQDDDFVATHDAIGAKFRRSILIGGCGTNDMSDYSGNVTTVYNEIRAFIQARAAAGWDEIYFVIPVRRATYSTQMETLYSTLIANEATLKSDGMTAFVDVFNSSAFADLTAPGYQADDIHYTNAGHTAVFNAAKTAAGY